MTAEPGTDLARFLREVDFPASREELAERAGDRSIRFGRHPLRLRHAIRAIPKETFREESEFVRGLQETVPDEESLH